jgi:glycosyltransferase involved in cell wall biosynthesis
MFRATHRLPIEYRAPWNADFADRLQAMIARPRHIAYFYESPDTSTFRYRVFNMVQALAGVFQGETSAAWFHTADLGKMESFVDRADALVLCRTRYRPEIDRMLLRARARGVRILYDVDDLVFDPAHVTLVLDTLKQNITDEATLDLWFASFARNGNLLRLSDRAIATNGFLAQRISAFAPHVETRVIPNFLNQEQQALSSRLFTEKQRSGFLNDDRVHVGYFSGSPTHDRDFAIAAPALARILETDPRVVLRIAGFLNLEERLARHSDRIEFHPLQDFLNLQRLIAEVEINIAPLQNNLFTNCKSELKYFEAAITGSITIASPIYTFARAIADGENSFLAASYEWDVKLKAAIDLTCRPERYAEMAVRGFKHARANYGWNRYASLIEETIFANGAEAPSEPPAPVPGLAGAEVGS